MRRLCSLTEFLTLDLRSINPLSEASISFNLLVCQLTIMAPVLCCTYSRKKIHLIPDIERIFVFRSSSEKRGINFLVQFSEYVSVNRSSVTVEVEDFNKFETT